MEGVNFINVIIISLFFRVNSKNKLCHYCLRAVSGFDRFVHVRFMLRSSITLSDCVQVRH